MSFNRLDGEEKKEIEEPEVSSDEEEILKKYITDYEKYMLSKSALTQNIIEEAAQKLASFEIKPKPRVLDIPNYNCFIEHLKDDGFKNIITIVGAGISTAAGLPDFRTPHKGLCSNLDKYELPSPQSIFEIDYFLQNPAPFYDLAKTLIPGKAKPTISHYFIKLLENKGLLLRHYTQNIDGLERKTGLSEEILVEAHGTFETAHCTKCNKFFAFNWLKEEMFKDDDAGIPICTICYSVVKPDIVLFGESLPTRFFECSQKDFKEADLLIIMGSSLTVEPFASLVKKVRKNCPRIIINDKEVGKKVGIMYDPRKNKRDVYINGTCDEGCRKIIKDMGWEDEFENMAEEILALIDQQDLDEQAEHLEEEDTVKLKMVGSQSELSVE